MGLLRVVLIAVGLFAPPLAGIAPVAEARGAAGAARAEGAGLRPEVVADVQRQATPPRRTRQAARFESEAAPDGRPMRVGSLIVKFRPGAERGAAHHAAGAVETEKLGRDEIVRVEAPKGAAEAALAAYRRRRDVEYAEPDYVRQFTLTPNDPLFAQQYGPQRISAPAAWDRTQSSASIRIAILDSGIWSRSSEFLAYDNQPGHPDIRDKVVLEADFAATGSVDDNFGHGTHVAGIAAASTNNGVGIAGVGFNASVPRSLGRSGGRGRLHGGSR